MRKTYSRSEANNFLAALEGQVREVITLAGRAESEANKNSYGLYAEFRKKVSECETFAILVETRLKNLEGGRDAALQERFDRMTVIMYNNLIKASIRFLFALSASTSLPMGARDMFLAELRYLHNAKNKLGEERYANRIDDATRHNLQLAEDIIAEIIDKAPNLLSFSM